MKVTYKTPSGKLLLMLKPVGHWPRRRDYALWARVAWQVKIFGVCFTHTTGETFVLEAGDAVPAYSKPCVRCANHLGYVYVVNGTRITTCPSCKGWGIAR